MAGTKPALRKPEFIKVIQLSPGTNGHTLIVKVVDAKTVLAKGSTNAPQVRQMRLAECLVGDETGMIVFTARNEQGSMRLAVDKWGRIEITNPTDFTVKEDNNLSLIEYDELVTVAKQGLENAIA